MPPSLQLAQHNDPPGGLLTDRPRLLTRNLMIPSFRCTAFSEAFIKFCSATTVMLIAASGASARVLLCLTHYSKKQNLPSQGSGRSHLSAGTLPWIALNNPGSSSILGRCWQRPLGFGHFRRGTNVKPEVDAWIAAQRLNRLAQAAVARAWCVFSAFSQAKHTVPEGRLDNRPALQRRLVTIPKSAPSRRAGVSRQA